MRPFYYIPVIILLLCTALPAAAQKRLGFSLNADNHKQSLSKPLDAARFTDRRPADYLQYGFPRVKTSEEKKAEATDRYFRNLVTNKNRNGFIGNLLGLQRVRPARGGVPRF